MHKHFKSVTYIREAKITYMSYREAQENSTGFSLLVYFNTVM